MRLFPVFRRLNNAFEDAIGKLTWDEAKALFEEKDIWHTPILTASEFGHCEQAKATGVFCDSINGTRLVAAPCSFSRYQKPVVDLNIADSGQHNSLLSVD